MSINDRLDKKLWYIYIIEYYIAIKKKEISQVQLLTPVFPALWEAKAGRSQVQEFKTILAKVVKFRLY